MLIDPYRFATPSVGDVLLLLHANDTPALVDATGLNTISITGAGALDNAQALFGTHSFRNPGTGDANAHFLRATGPVSPGTHFAFGGEFTMEGWFYMLSKTDQFMNFFANSINFNSAGFWQMGIQNSTNRLIFNSNPVAGSGTGFFETANPGTTPLNAWFHLAVTRDASNVVRVFRNGVVLGSATISGTIGDNTFDVGRGSAGDNGSFNGYWEEIRVTDGCEYSANFTPPGLFTP